MYDAYLYHHGILGQSWGKLNGPPYPLSPGAHSAAEKKAGWKKSLDKDTVDTKQNHKINETTIKRSEVVKEKNKKRDLKRTSKEVANFVKNYGPAILTTAAVVGTAAGTAYVMKKNGIKVSDIPNIVSESVKHPVKTVGKVTGIEDIHDFRNKVGEKVSKKVNSVKTKISNKRKEKVGKLTSSSTLTTSTSIDKPKPSISVSNTTPKLEESNQRGSISSVSKISMKNQNGNQLPKEISTMQKTVEVVKKNDEEPKKEIVKKQIEVKPKLNKSLFNDVQKIIPKPAKNSKKLKSNNKSIVDRLLGKSGKKKVKKQSSDLEDYTQYLLRKNSAALGY